MLSIRWFSFYEYFHWIFVAHNALHYRKHKHHCVFVRVFVFVFMYVSGCEQMSPTRKCIDRKCFQILLLLLSRSKCMHNFKFHLLRYPMILLVCWTAFHMCLRFLLTNETCTLIHWKCLFAFSYAIVLHCCYQCYYYYCKRICIMLR